MSALLIAGGQFTAPALYGQSPDGIVHILVLESGGRPLANATVTAIEQAQALRFTRTTNPTGEAFLGALPAGTYAFSASQTGYTTASRPAVEVSVGSRQELTFVLSPAAAAQPTWDTTALLENIPTPVLKADTIASSVSVIIDENQIVNLPLISRNVYSLFLLQPGVTSQGANPRRGLTFSVHGQRVSSSNYLLDGVDNNNTRVSGPVAVNSLEGIHELRMVNSSFSADSGRATGLVAHLAVRRGGTRPHAAVFGYLSDDGPNATPSATKALLQPNAPFRQMQAGYSVAGPLLSNRMFGSSTIEISRLRYGVYKEVHLPTTAFISSLADSHPLRPLFASTPPLPVAPSAADSRFGQLAGTVYGKINTLFMTQRLDRVFSDAKDRVILRYTLARTDQRLPSDFTGYPDLWPTDRFAAHNTMAGWTRTWPAGPSNDLRIGWTRDRSDLPRPFSDRPSLQVSSRNVQLPATARLIEERGNDNILQITEGLIFRRGRSTFTTGLAFRKYFANGVNGGLESVAYNATSVPAAGLYLFSSLTDVAASRPLAFSVAVDRISPELILADLRRRYRSSDMGIFVQHDLKLTQRLSLNMGIRWEYFGPMHDVNPSLDYNLYAGAGATPHERFANGVLRSTDQNPGDLKNRIYRRDYLNFAPSFGIAWDPFGSGRTVLRAGYAIAYDRIFDAARDPRKNKTRTATCLQTSCPGFVLPASAALPNMRPIPGARFSAIVLDENLRTPYAQNWYFGLQRNVTDTLVLEAGHAGSTGRKLISRDVINRSELGLPPSGTANDIFLSNQGSSTYLGLQLAARKRFGSGFQFQSAYTWSHAIDNQSDILEGTRIGPDLGHSLIAAFTRAFDPRVDRGNANFDQRHNVIVSGIWNLPSARGRLRYPFSGWTTSVIAGYHSGFPLTVVGLPRLAVENVAGLRNNRPDLIRPLAEVRQAVPGGVRWLNKEDFVIVRDRVGNLGRNAIAGPSAWNCDFALMRTVPLFREGLRAQFRFEAYNVFNHANLSVPVTNLDAPEFGITYAGRSRSYYSRFGELPLDSPARRLQFALRFQF
ncbi:MAG: TonB-dependent receptor [Acidobacteria bacterium]|nr:TonB-dependent receptor [Acidobacteriota bacterium]